MKLIYSMDKRLKGIFYKNLRRFSAIITIPVMIMFLILYSVVTYHYIEQSEDFGYYSVKNLNVECDNILRQAEMQGIKISINESVIAYVASNGAEHTRVRVQELLSAYHGINSFYDSITIYSKTGSNFITSTSYEDAKDIVDAVFEEPMYTLSGRKVMLVPMAKNNKYPFLIRLMFPIDVDKQSGAVVIDINAEKIRSFTQGLSDNESLLNFVVCDDKIIFGENLKEQFNRSFGDFVTVNGKYVNFDGSKYILSESDSLYFPFKYISLVYIGGFSPVKPFMVLFLLGGIAACVGIAFLVALSITSRSMSPFDMLIKVIESPQMKTEDLSDFPPDIFYIIQDLRTHLMKTADMEKEMTGRLLLLKTSNVNAMQMQMNPHFLYNTLDMLSWDLYKKLGADNEVSKKLAELSDMYRMSVKAEGSIVTLNWEINYAMAYLNLMKYVEEASVTMHVNIESKLLGRDVIKFSLQPLVENVIVHGQREKEGVNIYLSSQLSGNMLYVYVDDDGVGMTEDDMARLNEVLSESCDLAKELSNMISADVTVTDGINKQEGSHLGGVALRNINSRIKMLMGDMCGINLSKSSYGGLRVTVAMLNGDKNIN